MENVTNPPPGYSACQRCGVRLAPLPLTLCRKCYVRTRGTGGETWDHANARQRQAHAPRSRKEDSAK